MTCDLCQSKSPIINENNPCCRTRLLLKLHSQEYRKGIMLLWAKKYGKEAILRDYQQAQKQYQEINK